MPYDRSCIGVIPADHLTNANKIWEAMVSANDPEETMGPNTFSVPCSATGQEPATHYGCHAWETEANATIFLDIAAGTLPEIRGVWADYGITEQDAQAAAVALQMSVSTGVVPTEHLTGVLSGRGLQQVVIPPPEMG